MELYTKGVDWDYFNRYNFVCDKYMPARGEGESKASQVVTAVSKLVYKWYNDGDVYDNVNSPMVGWANDLSSYANWLYKNCEAQCGDILCRIKDCFTNEDYEHLLKDLADSLLGDLDRLERMSQKTKVGTIYECDGPFEFSLESEDDEEEWW